MYEVYEIVRVMVMVLQSMYKLLRPDPEWGPALDVDREGTRYERKDSALPVEGFTNIAYHSDAKEKA